MEHGSLIMLAKQLLNVLSSQCNHCDNLFDYVVESAETDMLSCYCDSAYSAKENKLVIAEITPDEYRYGVAGRLNLRINSLLKKQDYCCRKYSEVMDEYGHKKYLLTCPYCGELLTERHQRISLEYYCEHHPHTLLLYSDGTLRELKTELEQYSE